MENYRIIEISRQDCLHYEGIAATLSNLRDTSLTEGKMRRCLKQISSQDGHLFVAIDTTGMTVGTATALIEQKLIHEGGLVGHIEDVATRQGHEGRGIASTLVKHALAYAGERGCYKAILDCDERLVSFYQRAGMHRSGVQMRKDFS